MKKSRITFYVSLICLLCAGCSALTRTVSHSQNPAGAWLTVTNWTVSSEASNVLSTLASLNQVNPTPSKPILDWLLGGVALGLGALAKMKNDKAKKNEQALGTIVQAVEQSNPGVNDVKQRIQRLSMAHGTSETIHNAVRRNTA